MRIFKFFMCLVFFVPALVSAQHKEVTFEKISDNTFETEILEALQSTINVMYYLVFNSKERSSKTEINV